MRIFLVLGIITLANVSVAVSDERQIDFGHYGQSPSVMAAVVSGLASVSPCSGPISYWETRADYQVTLNIQCEGTQDDEATAIITFRDYGGVLVVEKFGEDVVDAMDKVGFRFADRIAAE